MQSHSDSDARTGWLNSLKKKAEKMKTAGLSEITSGKPEEEVLAEWESHKVNVRHLPDDEHGILRISIGESEEPIPFAYCVFRGDCNACCNLLRKALAAMMKRPR